MASPPAREELVIHILPDLPQEPWEWAECCIYRVPKQLHKVNEDAYTPKLVSIGPFHHGKDDLKDMEKHKQSYLIDFLFRTGKSLKDLVNIIEDDEIKIRRCYSEKNCIPDSNHFIEMILLDAVFIIELFLKTCKPKNDYILGIPWLSNGIIHDLILLENQLPFFVLEKLYSSYNNREEGQQKEHKEGLKIQDAPFVQLSCVFFSWLDQRRKKHDSIGKEVKHFTDLVRYLFSAVPELNLKPRGYTCNLYSATKLDYAGLKFKADDKRSLLDITFSGNKCFKASWLLDCLPCLKLPFLCLERVQSILIVPKLMLHDNTEVVFRNLMALEQCHYPFNTYICNYVLLMSYLLNTEKDVDLLVEKNVIVNYIGSNANVATLFSRLCIQILEIESCYSFLTREINGYCDNCWNRIMASIRGTYFRDFGRGITTVAALLTLLSLVIPFLTK